MNSEKLVKPIKKLLTFFGVALTTIKTYRTKGRNGQYNIIRYFAQESHSLTIEEVYLLSR